MSVTVIRTTAKVRSVADLGQDDSEKEIVTMKTYIAITLLIFAALGLACSQQKPAANNDPHAAMNHDSHQNTTVPPAPDHGGMDHSMQSSPNAAAAPYDLQFLDTMIEHHKGAVVMSDPAPARALHPEIKSHATDIISSQQGEIAQMKVWRDKWFAGAAPAVNMEMPGMADSMKGMDMKLLTIRSGNDFDLAFIKQMIPHHEGAVTMANEALKRSSRAEIKTFAAAIIKAQESEIKQMKEWQKAWSQIK